MELVNLKVKPEIRKVLKLRAITNDRTLIAEADDFLRTKLTEEGEVFE